MKYMTLFVTGLLLFACNQTDKQVSQTQADAEQAAVQIAEMWLALIDEGKFEESWDESSSMFKNSVTKEQWVETMRINRPPLGKVLQRNLRKKFDEMTIFQNWEFGAENWYKVPQCEYEKIPSRQNDHFAPFSIFLRFSAADG